MGDWRNNSNTIDNAESFSLETFDSAIQKLKAIPGTRISPDQLRGYSGPLIVPQFVYDRVMQLRKDNPSYSEFRCLKIAIEQLQQPK